MWTNSAISERLSSSPTTATSSDVKGTKSDPPGAMAMPARLSTSTGRDVKRTNCKNPVVFLYAISGMLGFGSFMSSNSTLGLSRFTDYSKDDAIVGGDAAAAQILTKSSTQRGNFDSDENGSIVVDNRYKTDNTDNKKTTLEEKTLLHEVNYYSPNVSEVERSIGWQHWCNTHQKPGYEFAPFADKHGVKAWVNQVDPSLYVPKELAYVNDANDITKALVQSLPDQFMMKATHLSGGIVRVYGNASTLTQCLKSPCDGRKATEATADYLRRMCDVFLQRDYAIRGGEFQYSRIPRRCIFEEHLDFGSGFQDYKVFMIHGRPIMVIIYGDRFGGRKSSTIRTPLSWHEVPFDRHNRDFYRHENAFATRSSFVDEMLQHSITLYNAAKQQTVHNLTHVRVDFFVFRGRYTFAEMTFSHSKCHDIFAQSLVNQFLGYVASHPEKNINPDAVLSLALESSRACTAAAIVSVGAQVKTFLVERCIRSLRTRGNFDGRIMVVTDANGLQKYNQTIRSWDSKVVIVEAKPEHLSHPRADVILKTFLLDYLDDNREFRRTLYLVHVADTGLLAAQDVGPMLHDYHEKATALKRGIENTTDKAGILGHFEDRGRRPHDDLVILDRRFSKYCLLEWRSLLEKEPSDTSEIALKTLVHHKESHQCYTVNLDAAKHLSTFPPIEETTLVRRAAASTTRNSTPAAITASSATMHWNEYCKQILDVSKANDTSTLVPGNINVAWETVCEA